MSRDIKLKDTSIWYLLSWVSAFIFPITGIIGLLLMNKARTKIALGHKNVYATLIPAKSITIVTFVIATAIFLATTYILYNHLLQC